MLHVDRRKVILTMARKEWNYSNLAEAMGCSKQCVNELMMRENGTCTIKTIGKLSKALGLDPEDIIVWDD
jgi:DNA-binding Xre family transcriptional regulator